MMRKLLKIGSLFSAALIISGFAMSTSAYAEKVATMQDVFVQGEEDLNPKRFSGRLDAIRTDGRNVVIDDTLVEVSPLVIVDGVTISRERLAKKLNEGQTVEFRLSDGPPKGRKLVEILKL